MKTKNQTGLKTFEPNIKLNHNIYIRVQNSSRLPAVAGTLTTLAGYFSSKKYKVSCVDRSTEIKVAVS